MRTTSPVAPPGPPRLLRRQGRQGPPRLLRRRGRSQSQSRSRSQSQSQSEGRQRLTPKLAQGVIIDMVRSLAPVLGAQGVIIHVM